MKAGLEDVIAAETRLSHVDGVHGELVVRGHTIQELADSWTFEETTHLLFEGLFDELPSLNRFRALMGEGRTHAFALTKFMDAQLLALEPMDAMRALMARIPDGDDLTSAIRLAAAPGVLLPAILRARAGFGAIAPDTMRGHAEDMLRMLNDAQPSCELSAALDTYLVTVCDHGLNASTFAARVVASTLSGLTSSALAGLCALKGPLHGGAPGPVLLMLDGIGESENAGAWLAAALDRGDRLMGFGHRIYKVRDPRADALKKAVKKLAVSSSGLPGRLALAEAVETAALTILQQRKPDRSLDVNVEFYTALLLEALGFPADALTAVFAAGRTPGWIAHAREQRLTGRLLRPQSHYIGPMANAA